jgi:hypothetical protein
MSGTLETVTAGADQIAAQVRHIADLRRRRDEVSNKINEARRAFLESIKHLTDEANQLGSDCASAEAVLKASSLAHYEQTKATRPTDGVQVKIYTRLEYDPEMADRWTRERGLARIPERMDVRAFEKIARATPIEFVVEKREARVTISTNLDKFISAAAP